MHACESAGGRPGATESGNTEEVSGGGAGTEGVVCRADWQCYAPPLSPPPTHTHMYRLLACFPGDVAPPPPPPQVHRLLGVLTPLLAHFPGDMLPETLLRLTDFFRRLMRWLHSIRCATAMSCAASGALLPLRLVQHQVCYCRYVLCSIRCVTAATSCAASGALLPLRPVQHQVRYCPYGLHSIRCATAATSCAASGALLPPRPVQHQARYCPYGLRCIRCATSTGLYCIRCDTASTACTASGSLLLLQPVPHQMHYCHG